MNTATHPIESTLVRPNHNQSHIMTVKELMQRLQYHDPNTRIVVNGYEGGVDDLEEVKQVKIQLNVNTEGYYGAHEITSGGQPALHLY